MAKFQITRLNAATRGHVIHRLLFSGVLAIALAGGLAVVVRSEIRAADAKRHAVSRVLPQSRLLRLQCCVRR